MDTDWPLVLRARRGDERALAELYDRHAPRVYRLLRRLAPDDATAQDWAQDTWLRVLRALPRFHGRCAFATWLHRIALNRARTGWRRQERWRPLPAELAAPPPREPELALLERALASLPPRMRAVLLLHDVEGYTHEEIAARLGVAVGTCKSQLWKARARLRARLLRLEAASPTSSHAGSSDPCAT